MFLALFFFFKTVTKYQKSKRSRFFSVLDDDGDGFVDEDTSDPIWGEWSEWGICIEETNLQCEVRKL